MTYLDYKHKLEFGKEQFDEIDSYCSKRGIKMVLLAFGILIQLILWLIILI